MQQCGKILSKYIKIPINNKKHLLLLVYGSNNLMYDMLEKSRQIYYKIMIFFTENKLMRVII